VDEEELRAFIKEDYGRMVICLQLICGSWALAEDAVQGALVKAAERSRRGERIDSLRGWVAVVSRNLARSGVRRLLAERRAKERYRQAMTPLQGGIDEEDRVDLITAIRALRPQQREAVALFYFGDLPIADVANIMGLHPEAAKGLLHRARETLSRSFGVNRVRD
jgi:RNA polymerase sigma-70 factor (ECF subfamily)